MLAGAVLGPVGALAGAVGGAIAGSRAGAAASEGICDEAAATRPAGYQNWGGGRLGAGDASDPPAQVPAAPAASAPSVGDRIGETASAAGKHLGEAASSVGEGLSGFGSWMRKSVSSITGGDAEEKPETTKKEAFKPFEGAGQPLVADPVDRSAARAAAAEAAMRRAGQVGSTAQPVQRPVQPVQSSARTPSQVADDEALARRLQEQFDAEDAQR